MNEATISPLLATAALLSVVVAMGFVGAVADPMFARFRDLFRRHTQTLALAVTGTAMAGSLYYSESANFVPCEFCWYQRIAMYSLVVVFAVAVVTRAQFPTRYAIALAGAGLLISIYHYQLQLNPEQSTVCTTGVPCTLQYVDALGFVSIPFMAGCGFLSVLLLYAARWRAERIAAGTRAMPGASAAEPV